MIEKVIRVKAFWDRIFTNIRELTEIVEGNYINKKLEMTEFTCFRKGRRRTGRELYLRKQTQKAKQLCIQDYTQIKLQGKKTSGKLLFPKTHNLRKKHKAENLEEQKEIHLAKLWDLYWLQKQEVMGSATQLRPLHMKYRHVGAKSGCTKVFLMSPERDGKKTFEERKRETGNDRNLRDMTIKLKIPSLNAR